MDCGKKCVQVAHASIMGADAGRPDTVMSWRQNGMRKIVLKVSDLAELESIKTKANSFGVRCLKVVDAGLTQIEPDTITCLGFEPLMVGCRAEIFVTSLTKDLKLL
jgi:PTH2 family peptidyl-tRNA hydrolase